MDSSSFQCSFKEVKQETVNKCDEEMQEKEVCVNGRSISFSDSFIQKTESVRPILEKIHTIN